MKRYFNSLYGRVSLVFLGLLLVMGGVLLVVSLQLNTAFVQETEQKLNVKLAANMGMSFSKYLKDSIDAAGIHASFETMMMMNPRVEYYLLEADGRIINHAAPPGRVQLTSVNVDDIKQFLAPDAGFPLLGDDPRNPGRLKPFSAAPLDLPGGRKGYLYVILGGENYDQASDLAAGSFIARQSTTAIVLAVAITALLGLFLFRRLSRPFARLRRGVQSFEQGEYSHRIEVKHNDEIGELALAFNNMAATIESNIEKLEETDRIRRDLIANVSHDLRTPLASIQGYIETILLKDETLTPDERVRFLSTVFANVSTLGNLVEELFELSRLDAKQKQPEREAFSISELAQDIVLKLQPAAEARQVSLRARMDQDLPFVFADIGMIDRAISNLIENAVRYTNSGGEVVLAVRKVGPSVNISVQDTGVGIDPEELPHIFERFYRVDKSRSRASGGAGLGLAITKKIIEAHDSQIAVESRPDEGSTFYFTLQSKPV